MIKSAKKVANDPQFVMLAAIATLLFAMYGFGASLGTLFSFRSAREVVDGNAVYLQEFELDRPGIVYISDGEGRCIEFMSTPPGPGTRLRAAPCVDNRNELKWWFAGGHLVPDADPTLCIVLPSEVGGELTLARCAAARADVNAFTMLGDSESTDSFGRIVSAHSERCVTRRSVDSVLIAAECRDQDAGRQHWGLTGLAVDQVHLLHRTGTCAYPRQVNNAWQLESGTCDHPMLYMRSNPKVPNGTGSIHLFRISAALCLEARGPGPGNLTYSACSRANAAQQFHFGDAHDLQWPGTIRTADPASGTWLCLHMESLNAGQVFFQPCSSNDPKQVWTALTRQSGATRLVHGSGKSMRRMGSGALSLSSWTLDSAHSEFGVAFLPEHGPREGTLRREQAYGECLTADLSTPSPTLYFSSCGAGRSDQRVRVVTPASAGSGWLGALEIGVGATTRCVAASTGAASVVPMPCAPPGDSSQSWAIWRWQPQHVIQHSGWGMDLQGSKVGLWVSHRGPWQALTIHSDGTLRSASNPEECVDATRPEAVRLGVCDPTCVPAQRLLMRPDLEDSIRVVGTDKCISSPSAQPGVTLTAAPCSGDKAMLQRWRMSSFSANFTLTLSCAVLPATLAEAKVQFDDLDKVFIVECLLAAFGLFMWFGERSAATKRMVKPLSIVATVVALALAVWEYTLSVDARATMDTLLCSASARSLSSSFEENSEFVSASKSVQAKMSAVLVLLVIDIIGKVLTLLYQAYTCANKKQPAASVSRAAVQPDTDHQ